jgi:outer membrane protein assembly factor BamB
MKNMGVFYSIFGGLIALIVWLLFLSGLRWRTRFITLGVVVLFFFGLGKSVRFEGSKDGSGTPVMAWTWSPKKVEPAIEFKLAGNTGRSGTPDGAADFPGFLGADRSAAIQSVHLDCDWAKHPPQKIWRQPIGLGWSAFSVTGGNALTQEQRGENELVVCYELASGNVLWSHTNLVRFHEGMGGDGPRATPTIVNGRVYALGATGILDCLDLATGQLIWTHKTLDENGVPNLIWAKSSSPLVYDNLVVVSGGGGTNGPTLLAYQINDGKAAWKSGAAKASYSSPVIATLCGRRQILSVNAMSVTSHDPGDGAVLWDYHWGDDKFPKCSQPIAVAGDRVLLAAGYLAGTIMLQIKDGPGGKLQVTEAWKNRNLKSAFSSLAVREGFVYGLDDGILACVDLASGERKWKGGRYGYGQLLLVGDTLLVQTEPGPVVLVEANPAAYKEVAKIDALSAKTWNVPALAGEYLLVRNDQEAVCYKLPVMTR